MATYTLTDVGRDLWVDQWSLDGMDTAGAGPKGWSVTKRALRGGRRAGVDVIQVHNGVLAFTVIPTRGMGLWKGQYKDDPLGWRSPVTDGPVHPSLVNLNHWGGLGWLEGFDELLARCGLENNGAPYEEKVVNKDGTERHIAYTLHGKIAHIPAHLVAVHIDEEAPYTITIEGHVDEVKLFGPKVRMETRISTVPGSNRLTVRDSFTNLGDLPTAIQLLYHWNFGPPFLGAGSRFAAPIKTVVPSGARAMEGLGHFDTYGPPEAGFAEQVYFFDLHGKGETDQTLAMLRDREGGRAVALRFAKAQLPCFTLWKNTNGLKEGYVTGLEPGTNFPNPKPFEAERKRVVTLLPDAPPYVAETVFEVASTAEEVRALEREIQALQAQGAPTIHPKPVEPYAMM